MVMMNFLLIYLYINKRKLYIVRSINWKKYVLGSVITTVFSIHKFMIESKTIHNTLRTHGTEQSTGGEFLWPE
jgi:hypothetical protein